MLNKIAPLTKIILTMFVSVWALLLNSLATLSILVGVQILLILIAGGVARTAKAVVALVSFSGMLVAIQYLTGTDFLISLLGGLRMAAMTLVFVILLATTRIRDITAALIQQCRVPYEYAFMFTSALRFIPDFLAESQAVREAQACRGFSPKGNVFRRIQSYVAVLGPLVLRAVSRSETMAMSLEIRGFGARRTISDRVNLHLRDYAMLSGMVLATIGMIIQRISSASV